MARAGSAILDSGAAFPLMSVDLVGGGKLTLPGDLKQPWNVLLFNRGHW